MNPTTKKILIEILTIFGKAGFTDIAYDLIVRVQRLQLQYEPNKKNNIFMSNLSSWQLNIVPILYQLWIAVDITDAASYIGDLGPSVLLVAV